jgi:MoxR-like ATPase
VTAGGDERLEWFAEHFESLERNLRQVIQGKSDVLRLALVCLMAEGHLLIEDVPGVGKTSLAKALAGSIDGSWQRIQFTPDLLPSDVTGVSIFNRSSNAFEFHPGAVFANIVIGDEINRASPKTQSALLEVMEERQVTVDGRPYEVPRPFIVIATQNPIEHDGTYELPEAQIDRFLMRTSIGYPDHESEVELVSTHSEHDVLHDLRPVVDLDVARDMVAIASEVHVAPTIHSYVVSLAAATRPLPELRLGISPRGSLAMIRAARALAAAEGRPFVTPEDVKMLAPAVFCHRMLLTADAQVQGRSAEQLLAGVLTQVPVPAAVTRH